jgi:S1-C subfamily serine protease
MATIVISYRREDSKWITGRIFDRLESHFGSGNVFMDIDNIPIGTDFRDQLQNVLARCDILLAVVGPHWFGFDRTGHSRLHEDTDWVRLEIATALTKNIPVVPLLIDGTQMPKPDDLPQDLRNFAFRHAMDINTGIDFRVHMQRLINSLDRLLAVQTATSEITADLGSHAKIAVNKSSPDDLSIPESIGDGTASAVPMTGSIIEQPLNRANSISDVGQIRKSSINALFREHSAEQRTDIAEPLPKDRPHVVNPWKLRFQFLSTVAVVTFLLIRPTSSPDFQKAPSSNVQNSATSPANAPNRLPDKQLDSTSVKTVPVETRKTATQNGPSEEAAVTSRVETATQKVLGVNLASLTPDLRTNYKIKDSVRGVVVTSVDANSDAADKRLSVGDVIVEVAQEAVTTPVDVKGRVDQLNNDGKRSVLLLVSNADGELRFVSLTSTPSETSQSMNQKVLGLNLASLNSALRTKYNIKGIVKGVVITTVDAGSDAADKRLNVGDVIVEVAQEAVTSPADAKKRVDQYKKDGRLSVLLLVSNAEGELRFVALSLR